MALKQPQRLPAIAARDPNQIADSSFIAGVFLAARGTTATANEQKKFGTMTMKDVANIVLGEQYSPFSKTSPNYVGDARMNATAPVKTTPAQQATPAPTPATQATPAATPTPAAPIPNDILQNPMFKQLDSQSQDLVKYYWNILASQDVAKANKFNEALGIAVSQATPYWREKINIMKDEIGRALGTTDQDLASREAELVRRRDAITQDLTSNTDYLSLNEQRDLANTKRTYEDELNNLREDMAARGLSSSTIRSQAEEKSQEAYTGVITSIQRDAAKQKSDLALGAERDVTDIAKTIEDLRRAALEQKTSTVRSAEATLGSSELGSLTGAKDLLSGGISGSLLEQQASDILTRTTALMSAGNL